MTTSYLVTASDGAQRTIDADDYTLDTPMVTFRDPIGLAVATIPVDRIASIDPTYDVADERFAARRRIKELEREAELKALQATIERLEVRPNREQRRARS